ncbi:MAG: transcription elongation factor GreA [Planctomycetota bacterium]|nr:MAG: transcription elongation factor GreA [Planctomycetota bacterium]
MNSIPVTAEGKSKMQHRLSELEAEIPVVRKWIEEAREKGDLKENAEYHSARERLSMLEGDIADLKSRLAYAVVVDESKIDHSRVGFGATVSLTDEDGDTEDWQLVGQGDDDPLDNKILTTSPMGLALVGAQVGDTVEVQAPVGILKYTVKKISY